MPMRNGNTMREAPCRCTMKLAMQMPPIGPVAAGALCLVAPPDSAGFWAQLLEGQRGGTEKSELPATSGFRMEPARARTLCLPRILVTGEKLSSRSPWAGQHGSSQCLEPETDQERAVSQLVDVPCWSVLPILFWGFLTLIMV